MNTRRTSVVVALLTVGVAVVAGGAHGAQVGLSARVTSASRSVTTASYAAFDAAGNPAGTASWRVITGLGNCCENYLGITPTGRMLSLGGDVLDFSDDRGVTWRSVSATIPFLGAEGGAVAAPGGDIVGLTWDPYTGDRIVSYKYSALDQQWYFLEGNLHTPFADRPWVSVIPGPFTVGALTIPYLSVLSAGLGSKEVFLVSTDGLAYNRPDSTLISSLSNLPAQRWLEPVPSPQLDALQPIIHASITPLAGGGALSERVVQAGCERRILGPDLRWACFTFPDGSDPPGEILVDSKGRLHQMWAPDPTQFLYRLSTNGGRTWTAQLRIAMPPLVDAQSWDFKASGAANVTALAVHGNDSGRGTDQDMVIKISTTGDTPVLTRILHVGRGGVDFGVGLNSYGPRFDFSSLIIFPDGKVATSFGDSSHYSPAVAVEQ